jgi:uncharacterized RDD family membrane protein YckC
VDDDDQLPEGREAMLHPAGSAGSTSSDTAGLASFGQRAGGYVVDWVLVLVIVQVSLSTTGLSIPAKMAIAYGLRFFYATILLSVLDGQTLGMRLFGTRCVCDDQITRLTLPRAAYRQLAAELMAVSAAFETLGIFGLIPPLADLCWPLWDRENQTLHDKVAGTVVLH